MSDEKSFTGHSRSHQTPWSIHASDRLAGIVITFGGLGTIVAVFGICAYLTWEVLPLFQSAEVTDHAALAAPWQEQRTPLRLEIDEYQAMGWALLPDGRIQTFRADTGETLETREILEGGKLTAASFSLDGTLAALGFEDGSLWSGTIRFSTAYVPVADLPAELRELPAGQFAPYETGMLQKTEQGEFRLQKVETAFQLKLDLGDSPVRLTALARPNPDGFPLLLAYTGDGKLQVCTVTEKTNFLTGETSVALDEIIPLPVAAAAQPPAFLLCNQRGDSIYLGWRSGRVLRYDSRTLNEARVAETVEFTETGTELTALKLLLGDTTLISGDSTGRLSAWFPVRREHAETPDGFVLTRVHEFPRTRSAVTSLALSSRTRLFAAGYAGGDVGVYQVTTGQELIKDNLEPGVPVSNICLAPKDDGLFAASETGLASWKFDPKFPEITVSSLFGKVWYEGYEEPEHVWQSSSGNEAFEPKLGMMPLVFGTLKATFYSMLFGAPLALLAAIYTSEFLSPRMRSRIKPTVELMASLPSVVLGFLAALVFAPIVENWVPMVLASLLTVPATILLGAFLWQLIPYKTALRFTRFRLGLIFLTLPLGLLAGYLLGPVGEYLLFAGDVKAWLNGQVGSGTGAWMFLLLPLSILGMVFVTTLYVNPWLLQRTASWPRRQFALFDAAKFVVLALATLLVAWLASLLLGGVGLDPRGTFVDTYDQRNSLVVGFVMGFAIIPIIYTIAEDALSAVPEHLRAASLGSGATEWQTATRVVLPTAMSGIFSAMMIGLGRAVGETMIVLMAGGNTPIMEWNVFNGFRTLSANIAVELPEAVKESGHYRTLILAALTLFILTFIVNTIAELVRIWYRRKLVQL